MTKIALVGYFYLKCHYDQVLHIHFLRFRTQEVFPSYLAKFQSITNITTRVFWTFISENLAPLLMRKSTHGSPFASHIWVAYGAPLGGPSGCRSSAINLGKKLIRISCIRN